MADLQAAAEPRCHFCPVTEIALGEFIQLVIEEQVLSLAKQVKNANIYPAASSWLALLSFSL